MKYIYLERFDTSIESNYYRRITANFSEYEKDVFKYEKMLNEYSKKLNKVDENMLGNPDLEITEGKELFYKKFFGDSKIKVIQSYLDGLQWLIDYYFNNKTYHKWYYIYNKSPLIQDIYSYLKVQPNNFFQNSVDTLERCCMIKGSSELISPFEQLLYITPFDKTLKSLDMFNNYSSNKVRSIVLELFKNYKELYPDIELITKKVYDSDSNNEIDCRGAIYLNKCILNVIHDSNVINEYDVKISIRKIMSIDDQNEEYTKRYNETKKGGYQDQYKKYKNLYKLTGEIKHKLKYKYYNNLIEEFKNV